MRLLYYPRLRDLREDHDMVQKEVHPNNVKGILAFANCRNIVLVNSSPTTYNVEDYRYTYLLSKDAQSFTQVVPLLTRKQ